MPDPNCLLNQEMWMGCQGHLIPREREFKASLLLWDISSILPPSTRKPLATTWTFSIPHTAKKDHLPYWPQGNKFHTTSLGLLNEINSSARVQKLLCFMKRKASQSDIRFPATKLSELLPKLESRTGNFIGNLIPRLGSMIIVTRVFSFVSFLRSHQI